MSIDPGRLILADTPPEWETIPPEILDRVLPPGAVYNRKQKDALDKILAARWFLLRNEHKARCRSCRVGRIPGAVHPYLTLGCVPMPFNGLSEIIGLIETHKDRDLLWSGMRLGTIVPITAEDAVRYQQQINSGRRW